MFKKLKEKITEEVKISPQRFAEFTQSVSDRLQSNVSADENFFSIGEDDANSPPTTNSHGFSSVSLMSPSQEERPRRYSNASMASDVSFLPRYESSSMYHLQSDLDISASEMEDNVSTASSPLGHLSKEQIHSAFQKSQMRYHKYRGRFTDLARHYKELERENAKMKAVLVETQDKAIRRVQELKEQCGLEQKAKAHLESALRDEIDERNYKIKTLETKIGLLQTENNFEQPPNTGAEIGIQTDKLENLTRYLNDARKEIGTLNEKLQEMKANAIIFQTKEQDYKTKIACFEKEMASVAEREKENNLKLAQSKMELHNEILMKDTEISNLKRENEVLKLNLNTIETENRNSGNMKLENLQSQNKKLIDKIEALTLKSNNFEKELLKVESYKIEIENLKQEIQDLKNSNVQLITEKETLENQLTESQHKYQEISQQYQEVHTSLMKERQELQDQITNLRDEARKGLLSLEPKIREKLQNQFSEKEVELKKEFENKIEEISSNNVGIKDIKLQLLLKDDMIKNMSEEYEKLKADLSKKIEDYSSLENNHLELIQDCTKLRNTISDLEKEKMSFGLSQEKVPRLEAHINTLQEELKKCQSLVEKKEEENIQLAKEIVEIQNTVKTIEQKLHIFEEKDVAVSLEITENRLLEMKLQKLEEEKHELLDDFENERKTLNKMLHDHRDLRAKEDEINHLKENLKCCHGEIETVREDLTSMEQKIIRLSEAKLGLEQEVDRLQETVRIFEEKDEAINLDKSECSLLKLKLQKLEQEHRELMDSFEIERVTLTKDLHKIKRSLSNKSEITSDEIKESENNLSQIVMDIRQLNESKEEEIVNLSKENAELIQKSNEITEKYRLIEEKLVTLEVETNEGRLLELKLQKLQEDHDKLINEFEQERKMYNDLLEGNKELKEKENLLEELQNDLSETVKEKYKLEDQLSLLKADNVKLQEDKLKLEKALTKLEEKIHILEEKEQAINLDQTECHILELKLQKEEDIRKNLLDTFEMERVNFNQTYQKLAKKEEEIKQITEDNMKMKHEVTRYEEELNNLKIRFADEQQICKADKTDAEHVISDLTGQLESVTKMLAEVEEENKKNIDQIDTFLLQNEDLNKQLKEKSLQIRELSEKTSELHNELESEHNKCKQLEALSEQLDADLKNTQAAIAESAKTENENVQNKLEELNNEIQSKTDELNQLNVKLINFEQLYSEQLQINELSRKEITTLQDTVSVLKDVEEKYQVLLDSDQKLTNEISRLKDALQEKDKLEKRLTEIETDLIEKVNHFKAAVEENHRLAEQNTKLRECNTGNQKVQEENENLVKQLDTAYNEMSELKNRFQQITSDYQNISQTNEILIHAKEELEFRIQEIENLKLSHDDQQNKLSEENESLKKKIEEISCQLKDMQQHNIDLIAQTKDVQSNGLEIASIQQDFYEIKEKCDSLFVENKNLKQEYGKLEEKCNEFNAIKDKLQNQISELEKHCTEIQHEKQLLQDEIQELKISPLNYQNSSNKLNNLEILKKEQSLSSSNGEKEAYQKEIENLRDKITKYKSMDLTSKSSIEFYENELQKVKNQNDKLNRKLDETLVTLNHCAELSTSTEVEYLKNVLFNYMLGKESLVLARVIAAVCKFDPQQTDLILQREQQKQTLLGQLGFI